MKCEICHQKDATVAINKVENGTVTKLRICEGCAQQHGLDVNLALPLLSELLLGLGGKKQQPRSEPRQKSCSACGMRQAEFKKTSLLGCPACYEVFADEIVPFLESTHKGVWHSGKVPVQEKAASDMAAVQRLLKEAVNRQDFEEAARLRDQLRDLKAGHAQGDAAVKEPDRAAAGGGGV
jgi:protein arginine kinase activator